MSDDYEDFGDEERVPRPRDRKIDEAKMVLVGRFFPDNGEEVYYGRQLEVLLEREFFHWITKRALNELAAEGKIKFGVEASGHYAAHFYWARRHRYARRQIKEILNLISEFSDPMFTRALGQHGELLADAGFARTGFRITRQKVREVDGKKWTETNHDLDRLLERDGERYGVEIKNQLGYIDQTEFQTKLAMCEHFGVRPMFIARMMPKSYINDVIKAGGFALILGTQHYPLMADELARRVRTRLGLPVASVRELPETALQRFEAWHKKQLAKHRGEG